MVEENISILESNKIRCRWFVIVDRDVVEAHVFHLDMLTCDALDEFADVVCRDHDGSEVTNNGGVVSVI